MTLVPYCPPKWAQNLKKIPSVVFDDLLMKPTPIQSWNLQQAPSSFQISVKRDDMTGFMTGGNKIRKAQFGLAHACQNGYKHVMACGGLSSNNCRTVSLVAPRVGLKVHLFLRTNDPHNPSFDEGGLNLFLSCLAGADIHLFTNEASFSDVVYPAMDELAAQIERETGEKAFCIPAGSSDSISVFGTIDLFEELLTQGLAENFDDLVVTVGSAGDAIGLAIGNYLTNSKIKIHGFSIYEKEKYYYDHCREILDDLGLDVRAEDLFDIIVGYEAPGYGRANPEIMDLVASVAASTGIVLDPTYTGKSAFGMLREMQERPGRFQGRRVLFLLTGGFISTEAQHTMREKFADGCKVWPQGARKEPLPKD